MLNDLKSFLLNFNKVFKYLTFDFLKLIKRNLFYRKYLNHFNLNNLKKKFDFYVVSLDDSIYLLEEKDKNTYSREFQNKSNFDYYNSTADERQKILIKHFVKKGDQVIDIGSHIGLYSLFLSKLVGKNGKVFCFEPQDNIRLKLKRNCTVNSVKNVKIFECCVGKENGKTEFYEVDSNKIPEGTVNSSSIKNEKLDSEYFKDGYEIVIKEMRSLDSMFLDNPIKFIKIDTEGNEISILEGAKNLLEKYKPIILFEFHSKRVKYLKTNLDFVEKSLLKNYECFQILIDSKDEILALKKTDFIELGEYEGDIICFPKKSASEIIK